jgi:hypothetical protein
MLMQCDNEGCERLPPFVLTCLPRLCPADKTQRPTAAQLGWPDMRLPIMYTMSWPERVPVADATWPRLDFTKANNLTFRAPDRYGSPARTTLCCLLHPPVSSTWSQDALPRCLAHIRIALCLNCAGH